MTSIVALLHRIREAFGFDIWIRYKPHHLEVIERHPLTNKKRIIKICHSLEAVKTYLNDLLTFESVFSDFKEALPQ